MRVDECVFTAKKGRVWLTVRTTATAGREYALRDRATGEYWRIPPTGRLEVEI
jgi:hypothetical protein